MEVEGGGWYGEAPRLIGGGAIGAGSVEPVSWDGAYALAVEEDGLPCDC